MEQRNGFFYLMHKLDGTYLKIIPSQQGGERINIDEITEYLAAKRVFDYNKTSIMKALNYLTVPEEVKLFDQTILPEQETMIVYMNSDAQTAVVRFYPPSDQGALMIRKDIIDTVVTAGVKFGLLEDVIEEFLSSRVYCTDIVIAKAMMPVEGKNASVRYYFSTNMTRQPKMNEDGTVDFHQLKLINHVKKNDILAELILMEAGKPGIDVTGRLIKQKPVHNSVLRHGPKIRQSEDGLRLISEVDGHVYLIGDKIMVSDMYEIKSDIDLTTGDIEYSGSVSIKGNVRTGFTVRAKGTIFVEGVVEGATLISDAGIVLSRGMQGMNRGKLITKGDVVAKFIENATVECDGSVTAEAILHSKIYAGKEIVVNGRKGFVTGGELHSGLEIHVKSAGSTMGTCTLLEVGVDPKVVLEYHNLEKELSEHNKELYKLNQILELFQKKFHGQIPADKIMTYCTTKESYDKRKAELEKGMERFQYLAKIIDNNKDGSIIVDRTIYSGCKIVISNVVYYVRDELYCKRFVKEDLDIKIHDHTV